MSSGVNLFVVSIAVATLSFAESAPPSDVEIRGILKQRVNELSAGVDDFGIVVGLVTREGHHVIAYGRRDLADARPLDGDTQFEIGSVGKIFTALLLADMVRTGEVALSDPVARYLPGLKIPSRGGRSITLLDLATHTSALPFMPDPNAGPREFLATYNLPYDIGSKWEYSNLGYWLLGEALASRANTEFEQLVQRRVIVPLKLTRTTFDPADKTRIATGHDASLQPAPALSTIAMYSGMPAAGAGLFSTADDLSVVLAAALGYERSPLRDVIAATLETRRPASAATEQALGWTVIGSRGHELILRDGGTLGYASCIAFDPAKGIGVVVLSNQITSVTDIARHLLRPEFPLEHPSAARHTEIAMDARLLDRYAGRYDASAEGVFGIVRDGDHLVINAPDGWGLPPLRIRPESTTEFFAAELPLRVTFTMDADGHVTGMLVHPPRGQSAVPARRIAP